MEDISSQGKKNKKLYITPMKILAMVLSAFIILFMAGLTIINFSDNPV